VAMARMGHLFLRAVPFETPLLQAGFRADA
jgi:hypothetical protein